MDEPLNSKNSICDPTYRRPLKFHNFNFNTHHNISSYPSHRSYLVLGKHMKHHRNELEINNKSIVIEWREEFKGRLEKFKNLCY